MDQLKMHFLLRMLARCHVSFAEMRKPGNFMKFPIFCGKTSAWSFKLFKMKLQAQCRIRGGKEVLQALLFASMGLDHQQGWPTNSKKSGDFSVGLFLCLFVRGGGQTYCETVMGMSENLRDSPKYHEKEMLASKNWNVCVWSLWGQIWSMFQVSGHKNWIHVNMDRTWYCWWEKSFNTWDV